MRSYGFRLTSLVLAAVLWTGLGSSGWALGYPGETVETVYVMPSSYTTTIPTSYVVSTAWVRPTAYAVPTYYTTAYWTDPVVLAQPTYATTAYVRRGLLGRRWLVERPVMSTYATVYVPSAYYGWPVYRSTSYVLSDRRVVPTAYVDPTDCVCPPALALATPADRSQATSTRSGGSAPRTGSQSRNVESEPDNLSTIDSNVGPYPGETQSSGSSVTPREPAPGTLPPDVPAGVKDTSPTPPAAPRPRPPASAPASGTGGGQGNAQGSNLQGGQTSRPATGGGGAVTPATGTTTGGQQGQGVTPAPTAPGGNDPGGPPDIPQQGEVRRNSLRPTYVTSVVRPDLRNILVGTVLSSEAREPEEGVQISVRNANSGGAKATTTNAFGRFAVRLTDGDWAVDVTMPSGRVYEVSRIRVTDGVVTDRLGHRVPSLEITR